jgi:hypothetical protein
VEFVDAIDASEAQYHMNRQMFAGREITVVLAADTRKRPEDMRKRTKPRYGISVAVVKAFSVFSHVMTWSFFSEEVILIMKTAALLVMVLLSFVLFLEVYG